MKIILSAIIIIFILTSCSYKNDYQINNYKYETGMNKINKKYIVEIYKD